MAEEKPTEKRIKISKAQQEMMLAVLVASLALGVCLVLMIYFTKMIFFNAKVLTAQDESIDNYTVSLKNAEALKTNITEGMANNEDLESVARDSLDMCYEDGKKIDFAERYEEATTTSDKADQLSLMKKCSALRVIPDALPAQENDEALLASLNKIFLVSDWEPETLAPSGGTSTTTTAEGLGVIPVTLSVEADTATVNKVLSNIEKSIRAFDIQTATISWTESGLALRAQSNSYYTEDVAAEETNKTVYAKENKKGTK